MLISAQKCFALCITLMAGLMIVSLPQSAVADGCRVCDCGFVRSYCPHSGCCDSCYGSGGGNESPPPRYEYDDSAERAEEVARYDALHAQAYEASQRGDYREALRLWKQLQKMRNGDITRRTIRQFEAVIAWNDARTAADYRRAMAIMPEHFTQDNVRYVESLEANEKYERERAKRAAEDLKIAAKIRE